MLGVLIGAGLGLVEKQQAGKANAQNIKMQNANIKLNNLLTTRETALEISGLLAGQTTLRNQAADAYRNAEQAGLIGQASAEVVAAASGIRGASVDAITMDIDREVGNVQAEVSQSMDVEQFNLSQRLRGLVAARKAQLGQAQRVPSSSEIFQQAAVSTGLQMLGTYASSLIQYGGGKSTTTKRKTT